MTAPKRRDLPDLPPSIHSIHLIGICGTGMGSLAGMLAERGYDVRGSDKGAYPPMSTWLEERNIEIMPGFDPKHLDWNPDLVVVGNVCRRDNPEAVEALHRGICCLSFPETLRVIFLKDRTPFVVTGTHGKTTTSSILAFILHYAKRNPSFMIGGITANFNTNFLLDDGEPFVVEGDEYDTAYFDKVPKFWHYEPFRATINNIEFDHGDIYPDIESIQSVFNTFAASIPNDGSLHVNGDDPRALDAAKHASCTVTTFGLTPNNTLFAQNITADEEHTYARVYLRDPQRPDDDPGELMPPLKSPLPGLHNVRNVLGAASIAMQAGIPWWTCCDALQHFKSVRKRQELKGQANGVLVYDDFAHHPTAVRATLQAIRAKHPNANLWAIFEAKSNTSRMAIFQDVYPESFALADHVILSAPWRKKSTAGPAIDIPALVHAIQQRGIDAHFIETVEDIVETLAQQLQPGDIVLGMSGSNFGNFHDLLLTKLSSQTGPTS